MIPILVNHNIESLPIGKITPKYDRLVVQFKDDMKITEEIFHEIFGNCGYRIIDFEEIDGNVYLKKIEIIEFSYVY